MNSIVNNCPVCKVSSKKKGNCRVKLSSVVEIAMGNYFVYCDNCGLKGPFGNDMQEAIEIWNRLSFDGILEIRHGKTFYQKLEEK